jgi:putative hydrolases of HD superfamily
MMGDKKTKSLVEFLKAVGRLKRTKRAGWINWKSLKIDPAESVADHSWRTSLISMIIADMKNSNANGSDKKINVDKVMRMALIHEIGEAIIGDWDYEAKKKFGEDTKKRKELAAVKRMLSILPKGLGKEYLDIFRELEENKSREAMLVNGIDVLEMNTQAVEYAEQGYDKRKLSDFVVGRYTPKMRTLKKDKDLVKILAVLRKQMGLQD